MLSLLLSPLRMPILPPTAPPSLPMTPPPSPEGPEAEAAGKRREEQPAEGERGAAVRRVDIRTGGSGDGQRTMPVRFRASDCRRATHRRAGGAFCVCSRLQAQLPTAPTATAESPSDEEDPPERRAAPGAGGGAGKTRGGRRKSRAQASSAPGGCDQKEAGALVGEQQDGRRPGSARPTTGDEASDDDDDGRGSKMDEAGEVGPSSWRGLRRRRGRWSCG